MGFGVALADEGSYEARKSAFPDRVDVRVRPERRRRWHADDKLAIVRETLAPGAVAQVVADRHGIGTGLLYTWRKQMLQAAMTGFVAVEVSSDPPPALQIEDSATAGANEPQGDPSSTRLVPAPIPGLIELELPTGVRLRVGADVNGAALQRVLAALAAL
jgi:transposase